MSKETNAAHGAVAGRVEQPVRPLCWITQESLRRLKNGGNLSGSVPVHAAPSNTAKHPLYGKDELNAAIELQRIHGANLREALDLARRELEAYMNLPIENDALWIEREKVSIQIMDKLRAALGERPWLESVLGPNGKFQPPAHG